MANASALARGEIADHMPVVGSDGRPFGTVDRVEGEFIRLTRRGPGGAPVEGHRYLPLSTVAGLDGGVVRLSMPAEQAEQACGSEAEMAQRQALDPDATAASLGRPTDGDPQGSRAKAHGGPKGQREHGQSGQAPGPPGETSFGVHRPV